MRAGSSCSLAFVSVYLITAILVGVKLCVCVVLICIFPMANEVKHLFMYLLVVCKSYLVNGNTSLSLLLAFILTSQVSQSLHLGRFTTHTQAIKLFHQLHFYLCAIYFPCLPRIRSVCSQTCLYQQYL